jgi:surface antigen
MPKQTKLASTLSFGRRLGLIALAIGVIGGVAIVHADKYDDQIAALAAQNAATQNLLNGVSEQAANYQAVVDALQTQINAVQAALVASQAQQAELEAKIAANQAIIDTKKTQLAATIKALYIDGQVSSLEQLASSRNLSDYIDKEEYRNKVQASLNGAIKEINVLQDELKKQKVQVDQLIASQQVEKNQLAAAQAQQAQLLAYSQAQQAAYTTQISANKSQIGELRRQQAIENTRYNIGNFRGDPGNGGYPNVWAYAAQDSMIDSWGMYNRECVSYTAFKVHQDYIQGKNSHDMPWWGGQGNANQWDDNARAAGIPVDSNPTPGSIAVSNAGFYGHVMYVEQVSADKSQIYISQYNQQLTGQYSEGWRYTTGLVFIHF